MTDTLSETPRRPSYGGLAGLVFGLALGAATLYAVGGPPHLPTQFPTWSAVGTTMRGASLPFAALAYPLTMAAWAVWFWIVASMLLRLIVVGVDAIAHGAAWVGALRAVSDRFTLPMVRRAVDGALIAAFVVNVAGRTIPSAAAATLLPTSTPHIAVVRPHPNSAASTLTKNNDKRPRKVEYTVQVGDTLWGIAEQFYGTGYEFPRLVAANAGRQMADGERFTLAGVIQPGWRLEIPLPSDRVHENGGTSYYVVEEGDTLRGIAARLLGNQDRWTALFDLNRDKARLNGHVLTEPDLIWPGLRLRIANGSGVHAGPVARPSAKPPPGTHKKHGKAPTATPVKPTPAPTSPSPTPTVAPPTPVQAPTSVAVVNPAHDRSDDTGLLEAVGGAAATAAAGGALLFARRRARRRLSEPPIPVPKRQRPIDDFAEAEPDRVLAHELQSGEVEPIVLVAEQTQRFLIDRGLEHSFIVFGRQGRNTSTLLLAAGMAEQERLIELAGELGKCLGGKGRAYLTQDRDIALQLSGPTLTGLILPGDRRRPTNLKLIPLGVTPDGSTLFVNWDKLGNVLVAGLSGGGTDVTLTSLLGTLAARRRPDELRIWTVGDRRRLPSQISQLPHQNCDVIDPADGESLQGVLNLLCAELTARVRRSSRETGRHWKPSSQEPELILVLAELAEIADTGNSLDLLSTQGPEYGLRIIAASERVDVLSTECLGHFRTRLILQTLDDEESIRLLGQPDGSDLGSGELYLRLDGRAPVRMRGFRISTDHLHRLVQLMGDEYSGEYQALTSTLERSPSADALDVDGPEARDTSHVDENFSRIDDEKGARRLPTETSAHVLSADAGLMDEEVSGNSQLQGTEREQMVEGDDHAQIIQPFAGDGTVADIHQDVPIELDPHVIGSASGDEKCLTDSVALQEMDLVDDIAIETMEAHGLIEVKCFGDFLVTSGEREISPSGEEGASYKAWELLAFLAVQPGGVVSRDKLLAAVWADVDMERASTRMRTAMKRLRALLARQVPNLSRDVVRADRDGMCRLDTTAVTSDAQAFVSAIHDAARLPPDEAAAALETARTLYRGDLLSGRGARFYEWVEERGDDGVSLREHYREQYYRATQQLARIYLRQGQAERAVPLYKSLLKSEPTLEDVVRELFRCYQQLGDLSSLIREERHLRQSLREAYSNLDDSEDYPEDYQPEPETVALFAATRDQLVVANNTSRDDRMTSVR